LYFWTNITRVKKSRSEEHVECNGVLDECVRDFGTEIYRKRLHGTLGKFVLLANFLEKLTF